MDKDLLYALIALVAVWFLFLRKKTGAVMTGGVGIATGPGATPYTGYAAGTRPPTTSPIGSAYAGAAPPPPQPPSTEQQVIGGVTAGVGLLGGLLGAIGNMGGGSSSGGSYGGNGSYDDSGYSDGGTVDDGGSYGGNGTYDDSSYA